MPENTNKSLAEYISELPKEKQPERDLWAGIEFALQDNNAHVLKEQTIEARPLHKWMASAAVIVIAIAGLGSFNLGMFNNNDQTAKQGAELIELLDSQHKQQVKLMLTSYAQYSSSTTNWQQQLDELDEAANVIKEALKQAPNNAALLKMLQHVYRQQLALINKVHSPMLQII